MARGAVILLPIEPQVKSGSVLRVSMRSQTGSNVSWDRNAGYLRPADCKCLIAKLPTEVFRDPESRATKQRPGGMLTSSR